MNHSSHVHSWWIAVVSLLLLCSTQAHAAMSYDYDQQWAFDSETGLYWRVGLIPATTFVPDVGTVATSGQLAELLQHVGAPLIDMGSTAAYSPALADLLSFFAFNQPAQSASTQPGINLFLVYDDGSAVIPSRPEWHYNYVGPHYTPASPDGSLWLYSNFPTLGPYGPGFSCPSGGSCPEQVGAYIVSATPPVPLPAGSGLLFAALAIWIITLHLRRPGFLARSSGRLWLG